MHYQQHTILALVQLVQTKGLGPKTLGGIIEKAAHLECDLEEVVTFSPDDLVSRFDLKREVAEGVAAAREGAETITHQLMEADVGVILKGDQDYPERLATRLKGRMPPLLFVRGRLSLLENSAVGFTGSRKASDRGVKIAGEVAYSLASKDVNIVSGYAFGVDLKAHESALEADGVTTFVLAEGILQFRPKREISEFLTGSNYLVISEFPPKMPWAVSTAMQRNHTICGLSDALVVIEAGEDGGTFEAAKTALGLKMPVFVVDYREPPPSARGNAKIIRNGARPLKSTNEGKPNLNELLQVIAHSTFDSPIEVIPRPAADLSKTESSNPTQLSLGFSDVSDESNPTDEE